jgi:hypothetical protein
MVRRYRDEPDETEETEDEYLDRERHDHGLSLWRLAGIFEPLRPGEDTRYRDFHLAVTNDWKVVSFEIGRWSVTGNMAVDIDLFAVRRDEEDTGDTHVSQPL